MSAGPRTIVQAFMNLYHSGFYHRRGKPGAIDIHGGDFYMTPEEAAKHIEVDAGFIGTVPFEFSLPLGERVKVNPATSIPIPLSTTRAMVDKRTAEWITLQLQEDTSAWLT